VHIALTLVLVLLLALGMRIWPQFATPPGQARRYGSDFAMESAAATLTQGDTIGLRASRAAGGLSNLWGAAVLPYRQADIADWPITTGDLAPHYRAVADFMPIAGQNDDLNALLPAFDMAGRTPIPPGPQALEILTRLSAAKPRLDRLGAHIGAARTAVDAPCTACGMCLHGCPWGYIYTSQRTLEALRQHPNFTYRPNLIARRFAETADGATLTLDTGEILTGQRLFIATGVLETARLVLASNPDANASLTLKDSQHAFVPMLHRWRPGTRPDRQPLTTLPQLFLEIAEPQVSPHLVHAQIYTWNEQFARDLIANYGFGLRASAPFLRALARRLIVAQIFLHSDHSARIELRRAPDTRLIATPRQNPATEPTLKRTKSHLAKIMANAGLTTLGFAARPGSPGSSFHVGASIPMAKNPAPNQSDRLGRPHGLERIHIVDASVLPSIPATTITFSAMANAHRIGSQTP
jgi:choline dehydrogenase-like flavoprotein